MKDLTNLRKIAEAATQGNWIPYEPGEEPGYWWVWLEEKLPWYGGIAQVSESDPGSICQTMITDSRDPAQDKADAVHIATFQPSTVLALIERAEAAEQALDFHTQRDRELKTLLGMLSDRLDEFSYDELSSLIEDEPQNQWGESYKSRLEQAEQAVARVRELHVREWKTVSVPTFDEYDEPFQRNSTCKGCGHWSFRDSAKCDTIRALDGEQS